MKSGEYVRLCVCVSNNSFMEKAFKQKYGEDRYLNIVNHPKYIEL